MRGFLRIASAIAGAGVLVMAAAVFWLFYSNPARPASQFPLDLERIRQVGSVAPGVGPERIEIERLSHTMVPKIAIVAGTTWGKVDMVRASYRLVFPDRTILIDTANAADLAKKFNAGSYDDAAWLRLVSAMDRASTIVVTHEHADHIGGLLESPNRDSIFAHAVLTREQVANRGGSLPLHWPDVRALKFRPLAYDQVYALAPGVVLIKAPGHTPGSQMIYVHRADGREFLFVGDTASLMDNISLERIRSRYVTDWYGGTHDDRSAVMAQTIAIHDMAKRNPRLILVPGHDGQRMQNLIRDNLLVAGFGS